MAEQILETYSLKSAYYSLVGLKKNTFVFEWFPSNLFSSSCATIQFHKQVVFQFTHC
jgi:hypothetical protein